MSICATYQGLVYQSLKRNDEKYCIFWHRLQKYDKMQSHTVNQCSGLLKSDNHFSLNLRKDHRPGEVFENSPHNHDSGIFREVTFILCMCLRTSGDVVPAGCREKQKIKIILPESSEVKLSNRDQE